MAGATNRDSEPEQIPSSRISVKIKFQLLLTVPAESGNEMARKGSVCQIWELFSLGFRWLLPSFPSFHSSCSLFQSNFSVFSFVLLRLLLLVAFSAAFLHQCVRIWPRLSLVGFYWLSSCQLALLSSFGCVVLWLSPVTLSTFLMLVTPCSLLQRPSSSDFFLVYPQFLLVKK